MLWKLKLAFTLDILRQEEVFTVVDHVGEVANPVAENNHAGLLRQLQINLNMPVTIDEIVNVGVILYVFFRVEH